MNENIEQLANAHCDCGENPYWNPDDNCVYWTDLPTGRLFRLDIASGEWSQIYSGVGVGGFTLQQNGDLLFFRDHEIAVRKADGTIQSIIDNIDPETGRFNDVFTDSDGSVYAGTVDNGGLKGGVLRVSPNGQVERLWLGTDCSNGMAISPDGKRFYWTDSTVCAIYQWDRDPATCAIANRTVFLQVGPGQGVPDGMAIDVEGNIWSARYDGSAIYKYSPAGEELLKIEFPVPLITSLCFGGPNMDDLYVTSGGGTERPDGLDGSLFRVPAGVRGLPEHRSSIALK